MKSPESEISRQLTLTTVKKLADTGSFSRGEAYLRQGHVLSVTRRANTLTARVSGNVKYAVTLNASAHQTLRHACTCPRGRGGDFCKHAVAVALAWIEQQAHSSPSDRKIVDLDDIRPWLLEQPAETLVDLLLDAATRDSRLREKLLRLAVRATGAAPDYAAYRRRIECVIPVDLYFDDEETSNFADEVSDLTESLQKLLDEVPSAQTHVVVQLIEHAIKRMEAAQNQAHDSSGFVGGALDELLELHLAATTAAPPDPEALARRLFNWEIDPDGHTFANAAQTYAAPLGDAGLVEDAVSPRTPGPNCLRSNLVLRANSTPLVLASPA
jgi:uncharacterized Zn finger protein